jgi:hypothetical protein
MRTASARIYACPDCAEGDRVHPLRTAHAAQLARPAPGHRQPEHVDRPRHREPAGPPLVRPVLRTRHLHARAGSDLRDEHWVACFLWGLSVTGLGALSLFLIHLTGAATAVGAQMFALWLLLGVVPLVVGARALLRGQEVRDEPPAAPAPRAAGAQCLLYCSRCDAVFLPYQASLVESHELAAPGLRA